MGDVIPFRRKARLEESCQPSVDQSDLITEMGLDLFSDCVSKKWVGAACLLCIGADPNFINPAHPDTTILGLALKRNAHVGFVRLLLNKGADVSKTPDALLETCGKYQVGKTELLLKYGANPNDKDADGRTPLMRSLGVYGIRFIRLLVKYGADVNAVDNYGRTALMVAAEQNNTDAVSELLRCGADPQMKDKSGKTAMELGMKWDFVVTTFKRAGVNGFN